MFIHCRNGEMDYDPDGRDAAPRFTFLLQCLQQ